MEIKCEKINHWETVILQGPFIVTNTDQVHHILNQVKESDSPFCAIDLYGVPFMDSSAIGVLLSASKGMTQKNGTLVIYGANDVIMDVFRAVQLPNHVQIYLTRDEFIHRTFG